MQRDSCLGLVCIDVRMLLIQFRSRQEFIDCCLHFLVSTDNLIYTSLGAGGHSETSGPPTDRDQGNGTLKPPT